MRKLKLATFALAAMAMSAMFNAAAFSVCAVGDSITQGGGTKFVPHRVALEAEFAARGWNVEWKGTRTDSVSPNRCEGYSGKNAAYIARRYEAHAADVAADVLLIHAGHNYNCGDPKLKPSVRTTEDIVAEATNAHARIIAAARAEKPDVIVLYAQVISSGGNREAKYSYITNGLNRAIAALGAELNTGASPVIVVDMAEGWNYAEDCVKDCVHPTASGAAKMAAKWMAALEPLAAAGKLPGCRVADGVRVDERAVVPGIAGRWLSAVPDGANGKAGTADNVFISLSGKCTKSPTVFPPSVIDK